MDVCQLVCQRPGIDTHKQFCKNIVACGCAGGFMGLGKKRKASVPVGGWVERQSGLRVTAGHHLLVRSVHSRILSVHLQ